MVAAERSSRVVFQLSTRDQSSEETVEPLHIHRLGHEDRALWQAAAGRDFFL
jgi:hypothetical protein